MGEWVVGAVINVVGSIAINMGTNLLKLGHKQREQSTMLEALDNAPKPADRKPVTHFPAWRLGITIFAVGNVLNFVSFGYAAQSLLAALGSVQFVSNVCVAYFLLQETVTNRILSATAFIVVGNIFLVAFGNHESRTYTHAELLSCYENPVYLLYVAFLLTLVAAHYLVYQHGRRLVARRAPTDPPLPSYWQMLLPFSFSLVSGAIGTQSVLFAKCLSILLRLTLHGDNQLDGWFTYAVALLFFLTAAFWMHRLNKGLALYDAILIVPMLQIVWTLFSITTGFIYFEEYLVFDWVKALMFAVGLFFLFCGMYQLTPVPRKGDASAPVDPETLPLKLVGTGSSPTTSEGEDESCRISLQQATVSAHRRHSLTGQLQQLPRLSQASFAPFPLGIGAHYVPTGTVFSMPLIPSSRILWRANSLAFDWAPPAGDGGAEFVTPWSPSYAQAKS